MNHLQIFLNTEIKATGILASMGNVFLAPVRFLFKGKTIIVPDADKTHIAKVTSFTFKQNKVSKQDCSLASRSLYYGENFSELLKPFLTLLALLSVIPAGLIGATIKIFSYLDNPHAKSCHRLAKLRLTPIDKQFEIEASQSMQDLSVLLHDWVRTGQKTKDLIISANPPKTLSEFSEEYIRELSPSKVIFAGIIIPKGHFERTKECYDNWDNSAVEVMPSKTSEGIEWGIVDSIEHAQLHQRGFFAAAFLKHKIYRVKPPVETPPDTHNLGIGIA